VERIGSGGSAAECARRWRGGDGRVPCVRVRSAPRAVHPAAAHQGGILASLAPGRHLGVGRRLAGIGRRLVDVVATLKALTWDLSASLCQRRKSSWFGSQCRLGIVFSIFRRQYARGDGALVARVAAGHDGRGRLSAADDGSHAGCLRVNEVARLQVCDRGPTI
jgi:hypothetical protein